MTSPPELGTLDAKEYFSLLAEWVTQCWLRDHEYPTSAADLEIFDFDALRSDFERKFFANDWCRIQAGKGVTAEEFVLWLQLLLRVPIGLVVNSSNNPPLLNSLIPSVSLTKGQLGAWVIRLLSAFPGAPFTPTDSWNGPPWERGDGWPVMLYVKKTRDAHVINLLNIDERQIWVQYEDPTWSSSEPFINPGTNNLGISATPYGRESGHDKTWLVPIFGLVELLSAMPVPVSRFDLVRETAKMWDVSYAAYVKHPSLWERVRRLFSTAT